MFKSIAFLILFLLPLLCFGYTNFTDPPADVGPFITFFFDRVPALKGMGVVAIIGFVLTLFVGILKMNGWFKTQFDKWGKWKFILIMILGAIAELCINWPTPFTLAGFLNIIATGALGSGAVSIAFHHVLDYKKTS